MAEIIVKLGDNVIQKYLFDKEVVSIGRARDNDIIVENLSVSRNHARIRLKDGKYILTDLNSANGTYVNGVKIIRTELVDNDIISVGKHKLHFVNKAVSDEQVILDAFGADKTMLVEKAPSAKLMILKGKHKDKEFVIKKYETSIGRTNDNDICLHDWFVSKKHAMIIRQGNNFFIKDLGSWKGTFVNDKQVRDSSLNNNDVIQIGTTKFQFFVEEEEEIAGRVPLELPMEESFFGVPPNKKTEEEKTPAEEPLSAVSSETSEQKEDIETTGEEEVPVSSKDENAEFLSPIAADSEEEKESEALKPPSEELEGVTPSFDYGFFNEEKASATEEQFSDDSVSFEYLEEVNPPEEDIVTPEQEEAERVEAEKVEVEQVEVEKEEVEIEEKPTEKVSGNNEVDLWLSALKSKSPVIRDHAKKQLKKLTGKDYD